MSGITGLIQYNYSIVCISLLTLNCFVCRWCGRWTVTGRWLGRLLQVYSRPQYTSCPSTHSIIKTSAGSSCATTRPLCRTSGRPLLYLQTPGLTYLQHPHYTIRDSLGTKAAVSEPNSSYIIANVAIPGHNLACKLVAHI